MAEGVELGTAFVSIIPEVSKVGTLIKDALMGAGQHADEAGKNLGQRLGVSMAGALQNPIGEVKTALGNLGNVGGDGALGLKAAAIGAAGAIGAVGAAAIEVTTHLFEMGHQWAELSDNITYKTGLIGDAAEDATNRIAKLGTNTAAPLSKIGDVMGDVIQNFGDAGDATDALTKNITDFDQMNQNATLNVHEFALAMHEMNVPLKDAPEFLDQLVRVHDKTGAAINDLTMALDKGGISAKQFGIDSTELLSILGTMEQAGMPAMNAMMGLKIALGNITKPEMRAKYGEDPETAIRNVMQAIKDLYDTGKEGEADQLAKTVFGARAYQPWLEALETGKVNIKNINTEIAKTGPGVEAQREATKHFNEDWQQTKNTIELALKPLSQKVFTSIDGELREFTNHLRTTHDIIGSMPAQWDAILAAMNPALGAISWLLHSMHDFQDSSPTANNPGISALPGLTGNTSPQGPGSFAPGTNPLDFGGNLPGSSPSGVNPFQKPGGGNSYTGGPQSYAQAQLSAFGWGPDQWGPLNTLIMHESGWNPNAQNPISTAYGIGQFLNSTWGTVGASKTSDPQAQIDDTLKYIKQRYGSPAAAWAQYYNHPGGEGSYAFGGSIPGSGSGDTVPIMAEPGEHMLTKADVQALGGQSGVYALRKALHMAGGGGIPWMAGNVSNPLHEDDYDWDSPAHPPASGNTDWPPTAVAPGVGNPSGGPGWQGGGKGAGLPQWWVDAINKQNKKGFPWWWIKGIMPPWDPGDPLNPGNDPSAPFYPWKPKATGGAILPGPGGGPYDPLTPLGWSSLALSPAWPVENDQGQRSAVGPFGPLPKGMIPLVHSDKLGSYFGSDKNGVSLPGRDSGIGQFLPGVGWVWPDTYPGNPGISPGFAEGGAIDTQAMRKAGFIPSGASETGQPGTSAISSFLKLGAEGVDAAIDIGAQAINSAAGAAAAAGSFGAAGGAGSSASSMLTQIGANLAKQGVNYGFKMAGIGADSLLQIIAPFGLPRWAGYDYTAFLPHLTPQGQPVTSAEKAAAQKGPPMPPGNQHLPTGATPGAPIPPGPGGPVSPEHMAGQSMTAPSPPPFGQSHGGWGSGAAPGAPPGQQQQKGTLGNTVGNLFGFDQGGWMMPGQVGVNMTRQPEPVFTDTQWKQIEASLPVGGGGDRGHDFSVRMENVYVQDADQLKREIDSRQKLAMMRYTGRPF